MRIIALLVLIFPLMGRAQTKEYKYVYEVPSECKFVGYVMGFGKTPEEAKETMIVHAKEDSEEGEDDEADTLLFGWPGTDADEEKEMEMLFNMGPDHHPELELEYQSKGALYLCR